MEKTIKKQTLDQKRKKSFLKISKNIFIGCLIIAALISFKLVFTKITSNMSVSNQHQSIDSIKKADKENYSKSNAYKYSNFEIQGTSWLSFRDVPELINEYVHGTKTLDLGCGAGRSTRFLKNIGLEVVGADISCEFIKQAHRVDKVGKYLLMKKDRIPAKDNSYDLVFSSHVLLMIPTKEELNKALNEMHRVLKKDGICIAVTGSEEMHAFDKKWLSYKSDFPENVNPKRGGIVKLVIKDVGAVFYDYNWTNEDYLEEINNNGFEVLKIHHPIGRKNEGYKWLSEKNYSPYVIYVLRKN